MVSGGGGWGWTGGKGGGGVGGGVEEVDEGCGVVVVALLRPLSLQKI